MGGKKGYILVVDAVLALIFVLIILVFLAGRYYTQKETSVSSYRRLHHISEDALDVLNKKGVLDEVCSHWAEGDMGNASNISKTYLEKLIPENVGYRLIVGGEVVAQNRTRVVEQSAHTETHSQRLLVGYGLNEPTRGWVARAYLTSSKSKTTEDYVYFGGYVGQGNITVNTPQLPSDAQINEVCVQLNAGSGFRMYVDGSVAGDYATAGDPGNMSLNVDECVVDPWNYFDEGPNEVKLVFDNQNISSQYIGGGFLKIRYNTSQMDTKPNKAVGRYEFPEVEGIINLYDGFYVPGTLRELEIFLDYQSNFSTFLNVGGEQLYNNTDNTSRQQITLEDSHLKTKLIYNPELSQRTIPLRFGTHNLSVNTILDICLVNDRSGSMRQSGWTMNRSNISHKYLNIAVPEDGWSNTHNFTVEGPQKQCDEIELEAEDFDDNIPRNSRSWNLDTSIAGYSGAGYMYVTPDCCVNQNTGYASSSPELRYDINIPEDGTYYVWVRGYGESGTADSVHVGLDGVEMPTSDRINSFGSSWEWHRDTMDGVDATFYADAGAHTLNVWMREDGFRLDAITLSKDPAYTPSGPGCGDNLNGSVAVALSWDREPGFDGSEGSEFVLNVQRPDGTWIFNYPGRPDGPPQSSNAGGTVDPGGSHDVGYGNEYFSGICSNPQIIHITEPMRGEYNFSVYGWNLRPHGSNPDPQHVNVSAYVDWGNESKDDLTRNPTIISFSASKQASKSFVDDLEDTDRCGYVHFGNGATREVALTDDKTLLKNSIDATGINGGTDVQDGIQQAIYEFTDNGRADSVKVMIILTDGQNDDGPDVAIQKAQEAKDQGIVVFTIGLTAFVNKQMLESIATRPEYFYYTPDGSGLESVYEKISKAISAVYRRQSINVSGDYPQSRLYPGSYIEYGYDPVNTSVYGEITITQSTPAFNDTSTCTGILALPEGMALTRAQAVSYSAAHWTDWVKVNDDDAFNLWHYSNDYTKLGDPYMVEVPYTFFDMENNTVYVATGDSQIERSGCSADNRLIYTVRIPSTSGYGQVHPTYEGCNWSVEFEDGSLLVAKIPASYGGEGVCNYTSQNIFYNQSDAMSDAVFRLFEKLDYNDNQKVDIVFDPEMMEFEYSRAGGIRSLWGPVGVKLVLWM
ncbi:MAG: VWA domain-containing protein [Candidatus Altiarchaeales archaeon]|nr:VWA domain-containing protein [Candidatus Altiarchaeales archaeon]